MKVVVFIDTSDNKEIKVSLEIDPDLIGVDGEQFEHTQSIGHRSAQAVLPLIEKLLSEHDLEVKDVTAIEVNPGPGSFTGIRVGVAIANALGFLLRIPVNGLTVGEQVEPVYS